VLEAGADAAGGNGDKVTGVSDVDPSGYAGRPLACAFVCLKAIIDDVWHGERGPESQQQADRRMRVREGGG